MKQVSRRHRWLLLAGFGTAVALAVTLLPKSGATADGIPQNPSMFYTGFLEEDGSPVDATRDFTLHFWSAAMSGSELCTVNANSTDVDQGAFRIPIPDACTEVIRQNPDVWTSLDVGTEELGRAQLGAVPYAVESERSERSDRADNGVPPGTIVAFGGGDPPIGWLLCDGGALASSSEPELFAAIGTRWGDGTDACATPGGCNFNLPDLRGRFLRGADELTGRDEDAMERTPNATGGSGGAAVGSVQGDTYAAHSHLVSQTGPTSRGGGAALARFNVPSGTNNAFVSTYRYNDSNSYVYPGDSDAFRALPTDGGSETRPENAAVRYLIKR